MKTVRFIEPIFQLGHRVGLIFSGGLITWMLITDGLRDVSFQFSGNLFPVFMQESGGLNYQQIGWVTAMFRIFMMLSTIPGGWLSDKAGERVGIALGMFLLSSSLFILVNIPQGVQYQWLFFVGGRWLDWVLEFHSLHIHH